MEILELATAVEYTFHRVTADRLRDKSNEICFLSKLMNVSSALVISLYFCFFLVILFVWDLEKGGVWF